MAHHQSRIRLIGAAWFAAVAVIVASSAVLGATLATTALLLVLGAAPIAVALMIGFRSPSPTVAEVLHTVDSRTDGRLSRGAR